MVRDISWLAATPIAHRGLHNEGQTVFENTLSSCRAAIEAGFNIEVDLQPTSDGVPAVFHDLTLERMAADERDIRKMDSGSLREVKIGRSDDHIATLAELLDLTSGKVGLVLEMKGLAGADGGFAQGVVECLAAYKGPVVVMSFFHWLLKDMRRLAPHIPLGLVAKGEDKQYSTHKAIVDECDLDFVSYNHLDLPCRFASEFKTTGKPLICWTVETPQQEIDCRKFCDQITFEGFEPIGWQRSS